MCKNCNKALFLVFMSIQTCIVLHWLENAYLRDCNVSEIFVPDSDEMREGYYVLIC